MEFRTPKLVEIRDRECSIYRRFELLAFESNPLSAVRVAQREHDLIVAPIRLPLAHLCEAIELHRRCRAQKACRPPDGYLVEPNSIYPLFLNV